MTQDRALSRMAALAGAGLLGVLAWTSFPAKAENVRCPEANVTVLDPEPQAAEIVCRAAKEAFAFMTAHGFETRDATTVSIVDRLTLTNLPSSVGTYHAKTRHAELLTYEAALKQLPDRPAFGLPMTQDLYRSFIVHEIAHAIAHPNFVRRPVASAHEYIAYVTQLATMPEELRDRLLRNVDTDGYDHLKEVSDMMLMMDPNRFAVKSYLHFIRPGNRAESFRKLLTGQF